ncbi:3-hydroxybutyryl-CoA dehydrogenase [Streptomyces sp. NBC_01565]|uniref:3-hydroxybutyryl-CoA dehydrogenase n=1 Tax=unclassified Streptomyces TaxID=2593676 RepID=UPI0022534802|nr:3-hydroxybutyryl-CoA dehydrogenase [Streptomyces sp. NBC_01565]MCX4545484.1 3-hydroxybutyryl-CoA dehydrogenase [Streptomyces sp. NBC_01565]
MTGEASLHEPVSRVGVIGCGVMGAGIADIAARAGLDVRVVVSRPEAVAPALDRVRGSLGRCVRKGRLTEAERDDALARVEVSADLERLADREFVIEAVPEDEELKTALFARVDGILKDEGAVLATNTSSLPISRLARATHHPQRVIGVHFFSPVPVMSLVELVSALPTSEQTRTRTAELLTGPLGKSVVDAPDRAGFMVNGLLIPYLLGAMRMLESGRVSAEAVDRGMTLGCGHPVGPLRLADLIGLDVIKAVADALHREFAEPQYLAPTMLLRLVESGMLGKKTGRGFHTYDG